MIKVKYHALALGMLFTLLSFRLAAAEIIPTANVLITYQGKWNNMLTRYSIPTVIRRAAQKLGIRVNIKRTNHANYVTPLFRQSSFVDIQQMFTAFPAGARDPNNIIKLDFFRPLIDVEKMRAYLTRNKITHIVIPGGTAPAPFFYGTISQPEAGEFKLWRDIKELTFILLAKEMGIPVLAICRGMQLTNALLGGTIQHVMDNIGEPNNIDWNIHRGKSSIHPPHHPLYLVNPSIMKDIYLPQEKSNDAVLFSKWRVTSIHYRALDKVSPYFDILAFAPITMSKNGYTEIFSDTDPLSAYTYREGYDVVEAVQYNQTDFWLLGIQFHSEFLSRSSRSIRMYQLFLKEPIR